MRPGPQPANCRSTTLSMPAALGSRNRSQTEFRRWGGMRHFVLPGRVSPLLRARKVSACGRFAASVLFFASTVANFCVYWWECSHRLLGPAEPNSAITRPPAV